MKFDIITIFPKIFDSYFNESILARAQKKELIQIKVHNLRDYTADKHKSVDDSPYGGGVGMVMKADVIATAIAKLKKQKSKIKSKAILFSPAGERFTQKDAQRLSKYNQLVLICGRYEGIDHRVEKYLADEVFSIGDFVLSGGEIPAMVLVESVSRLIKGVLGKTESIEEKRYGVGVPTFTRPEEVVIKGKKHVVPKILLSGDHKKIEEWRKAQIKK
ncbi:MAG: tRNA (guanosine(37)-N1)-methyltransferase TrmD [Candidatus Sungbacteria bacterium]|uniref:tRNA (guanine-N(1)-)-methyltransferase n=1 Tax=Candidatus Sungiibacteriota bacterium TaxID=2750080 RepID=A0A931YE51_9BACT|nr:tRNA (guanosine(37)-N1)-methyltransferase TrmD [Candidatus Sungbacteria bacterium]MBI2466192.1 tRNA (guanosine(37)-N1)-methyltransferase TrmD [Candidatus Sungbacteria bacterium]